MTGQTGQHSCLMYADDLILIARSEFGLQALLNNLTEYLRPNKVNHSFNALLKVHSIKSSSVSIKHVLYFILLSTIFKL